MNLRPIVALALMLTACAEPNPSDTQHTSSRDAGIGSTTFDDVAPRVNDAGGITTTSPTLQPIEEAGVDALTSDGSSTASTDEVNPGQPTSPQFDAGSNENSGEMSTEDETSTEDDGNTEAQTTATDAASTEETTVTPGCGGLGYRCRRPRSTSSRPRSTSRPNTRSNPRRTVGSWVTLRLTSSVEAVEEPSLVSASTPASSVGCSVGLVGGYAASVGGARCHVVEGRRSKFRHLAMRYVGCRRGSVPRTRSTSMRERQWTDEFRSASDGRVCGDASRLSVTNRAFRAACVGYLPSGAPLFLPRACRWAFVQPAKGTTTFETAVDSKEGVHPIAEHPHVRASWQWSAKSAAL